MRDRMDASRSSETKSAHDANKPDAAPSRRTNGGDAASSRRTNGGDAASSRRTNKGDAAAGPRTERLLERIHDQLERFLRRERQEDFSFVRLVGTLLQMLAAVTALWGIVTLLSGADPAAATARLLLACFFQLAFLTALVADRLR